MSTLRRTSLAGALLPALVACSPQKSKEVGRIPKKTVDKAAALGRRGPMIGGELPARPSEALTEHLWVCPFPEDDVRGLLDVIGPEHVVFGSDYPHPEGLAEPCSYVDHLLPGLDDDVVASIMGRNLADIMRVPVAA